MYKILIKNKNNPKLYHFYTEIVKGTEMEYETDKIEKIGNMYKLLLSQYPAEQLKIVQTLEPEITVSVEDPLPAGE